VAKEAAQELDALDDTRCAAGGTPMPGLPTTVVFHGDAPSATGAPEQAESAAADAAYAAASAVVTAAAAAAAAAAAVPAPTVVECEVETAGGAQPGAEPATALPIGLDLD